MESVRRRLCVFSKQEERLQLVSPPVVFFIETKEQGSM